MGRYRRGPFKPTGYTEYSPVYQPPEPTGLVEPDYSQFTFRSRITGETPAPSASTASYGFFSVRQSSTAEPVTPDTVDGLLTSQIVPSPFTSIASEFEAPGPRKAMQPPRPKDPMYSGAWGLPPQNELPPEPEISFAPADYRVVGLPLTAISRAVNEKRQERAQSSLAQLRGQWKREVETVRAENQRTVLDFEQRVRSDPRYQAYLVNDRNWLEASEKADREYAAAIERWKQQREQFYAAKQQEEWFFSKLQAGWEAKKPEAIQRALEIAVRNSKPPWQSKQAHYVAFDPTTGIVLVEYEFPDVERLNFAEPGARGLKSLGKARLHDLRDRLVYSLAMRVLFDLACLTRCMQPIQGLGLNGHVTFIDRTNGHERTETILSVFVKPDELLGLRISHVDPKAAFRALKGSMTASLADYAPVAPIMRMDRNDGRIVEAREVISGLRRNENLAAMDWEDFEHLIRELFEKEFAQNGVEVKVTRASRDSGVDAIAFDPDPLRGGKFVIQAKRYTRTVDVSAVRDLFGTLQNEGANRGILVTTSRFGPDSYELARGKPITLIDGPNLLSLLRRHGYEFSVDLEAARRLNVSRDNTP